MRQEEKTQYNGFAFNIIIYAVTLILGAVFPFVVRTILSFIIETPSITELRGDASRLFNIIYPILGVLTTAAFLFGGFYCSMYTAKKIAYKSREPFVAGKAKLQIAISTVLSYAVIFYFGVADLFTNMLGIQFWYFPASIASWTGIVDASNITKYNVMTDVSIVNFALKGVTSEFMWIIIIYSIILTVGYGFTAYYGRKIGTMAGLNKLNRDLDNLHGKK